MVRIWVASLHQKDQRRKYAGLFLLQKTKVTPLRVDSNSCGPALASRRAKKPQWGFFSSAARRTARAHQKDQCRKYAGLFLLQKPQDTPSRVDSNSCGPALAFRRAKKPRWGFFSSAARRTARAHQKDQRIKNGSARKLNRKAVSFQASRGVLSGRKQKSTKKFKKRLTFPEAVV